MNKLSVIYDIIQYNIIVMTEKETYIPLTKETRNEIKDKKKELTYEQFLKKLMESYNA